MQSAAVKTLRAEEVFTTAVTATFIFLAGDLTKWSATRAQRWRLLGVLISLLAGAVAGGLILIHARLLAPFLPFMINSAVVAFAAILLREPPQLHAA